MKTMLIVGLLLLVACQSADLKPVNIATEDMCAFCKMAISEKRYAIEFIDQDGTPFKFDDIDCLRHYLERQQKKGTVAAYFVMNLDSRDWVKAEQAHYVRSSAFKTPMSGGIVAFKDARKAKEAVAQYEGELLSFRDIVHN